MKGSQRYAIWLEQAFFDLKAAKVSKEKGFYEWSCYQSVQSVEKALKSILVHAGWKPPKTHKLGVLVSMCNHANKVFSQVKLNFRTLESYTFISRYPFIFPDSAKRSPHELITAKDADTCIDIADKLFEQIQKFIKENTEINFGELREEEYYFTPDEVDKRISSIINKLSTADKIAVQKVILFGSFAREKRRPRSSTMDILVIGETELPFIERIQYVREITKGEEPIVEPIAYTEKEFKFLLDEQGEGFLESALEEGRVIWQKA